MQAARPVLLSFVLFLSILGCHSTAEKKTVQPAVAPVSYKPDSTARYMGAYTGSLGGGGIVTLVLNYISGGTVSGYSVRKGLRRNVNGEVTREGAKLHFELKEPGDNRSDGRFDFLLDTASRKIEGEWAWDNSDRVVVLHDSMTLTPMQWDENAGDNEWGHGDTTLTFHNNGTCKLEITSAGDNAQGVVIRGNFDKKKDTFLIEWEKNPYVAESVKMVEYSKRVVDGKDPAYQLFLRGGGMLFGIKGEPTE
jgi:hypothetical protein